MFVSTSPATLVEFLACPSAILRRHASPPAPPHAPGGFVEEFHAHLGRERIAASDGLDSDDVSRRLPFDVIPGPDAESICDRPGHRHLKLARDLGHGPYSSKDRFLVQASLQITARSVSK